MKRKSARALLRATNPRLSVESVSGGRIGRQIRIASSFGHDLRLHAAPHIVTAISRQNQGAVLYQNRASVEFASGRFQISWPESR